MSDCHLEDTIDVGKQTWHRCTCTECAHAKHFAGRWYTASKVKDAVIDHVDAVCYLVQGHELEDGLAEDQWPQLCWHASHQQWCTISIYRDVVIHCDSAPFVHHKALYVIFARSCLCGLAHGILRKDELPQQPLGRQFVLQGHLHVCDNQAIISVAVV